MTAPKAHERVTIVTVSYNSLTMLSGMLNSLDAGQPVVIVENGPNDHAEVAALAAQCGARPIINDQNEGFGPACNRGAAVATTEFLLFLNPDTRLDGGALSALVAAADTFPHTVAFNPMLTDERGKSGFKRRSVLLPKSAWMKREEPSEPTVVPVLSGAAFFVRRADFEAVGGFDPRIFLYHEDDDLALRLRAERGGLMVVPAAKVMHAAGQSTKRSPAIAALKAFHMGRSRVYTVRKHGVAYGRTRALTQGMLAAIAPDAWLSSRRRAKSWSFLKGVLAELRSPTPLDTAYERPK